MRFTRRFASAVGLLFLLGFIPLLPAQEITATVSGRVLDSSGAVVPSATVTLINTGTELRRQQTADSEGNYRFSLVPPGEYALEAAMTGFKTSVRRGVNLSVNQNASIDLVLEVGRVTDSVTVTADAGMLETRTNALGKVIDNRKIEDLPLLSRDYKTLGLLVAGALPALKFGGSERAGTIRGDDQGYFVNGLRSTFNSFLLDGASNNNSNTGGSVITPTPETIKEFKIHTNAFSAEFNGASTIVSVVTKSGTNEFHGSLFEYLRNDKLDARGFFDQTKPPLRRNQFGGAVGGPIRREQTFFFASFDALRVRDGVTRRLNVPSAAWRQGDFSDQTRVIRDPNGGTFAGNRIPSDRINPLARALLDRFYPLPNDAQGLYSRQQSIATDAQNWSARVDQSITANNRLFGRYTRSGRDRTDPDPVLDASLIGRNTYQSALLSDTWILNPRMVNEARLAYLRKNEEDIATERLDHKALGFRYDIFEETAMVGPRITISGLTAITPPLGGGVQTDNTWQFYDNFNWERGRHSLKIGGEYNWFQVRNIVTARLNGLFTFNGQVTGLAFADFLLGLPRTFDQSKLVSDRPFIGKGWGVFVQDEWRATPRFTLNIGLRYDVVYPPKDPNFGQLVTFWQGQQSQRFPDAPRGLLYSGDPQVPTAILNTDKNNFGPRTGFAWQVTDRWTVRSGYGVFFDTKVFANYQTQLAVAPPFDIRRTIDLPRSFADPVQGVADPFNLPPGSRFSVPLPLVRVLDRQNAIPYAQHWNFVIQRQLRQDYLLEAAYVGTKGTRLVRFNELNDAVFGPGATIQNAQSRRPFPEFRQIFNFQGTSNSIYHGLQLTLNKRFSRGFSVLSSYTWSKTIDDAIGANISGDPQFPQDSRNLRAERAVSSAHIPHRWVSSFVWQLPLLAKRGLVERVFGGWQFNGIVAVQSGDYKSVIEAVDIALVGRPNQINQRPNVIRDPNNGPKTTDEWFDKSAFVRLDPRTDAGRFGNAGRNIVQNPGRFDTDVSLFKHFRLREDIRLQFRAEFFNVLNHTQWNDPVTEIDSQNFGKITSAAAPRRVQLALKLIF